MLLGREGLIFIHIPKCGGRSVARWFGEQFEHRAIHEFQDVAFSALPSFTVVRNTWDRLVSMYHYLQAARSHRGRPVQGSRGPMTPFQDWLHANLEARSPDFGPGQTCGMRHTHHQLGSPFWFSSQLAWIALERKVLVDSVLRFERLDEEFHLLCQDRGLKYHQLPHLNAARCRRPYPQYYTQSSMKLVAREYGDEIETLRLSFDPDATERRRAVALWGGWLGYHWHRLGLRETR